MEQTRRQHARPYDPSIGRFDTVDPIDGGSANSYDYSSQDPINSYDLTGAMINAMEASGGNSLPWTYTVNISGGGTETVTMQFFEISSSSGAIYAKHTLKVRHVDRTRTWITVQQEGTPPTTTGDAGGFETLWNIARVGGGLTACFDGGEVGFTVGGPLGAGVGCLTVGLAFDLAGEQAKQRVKRHRK